MACAKPGTAYGRDVAVETYAGLATAIRALPPRAGVTRVVGVDGPAGSGKSVFAARAAEAISAKVICLDDLTPSWTGPDREAALLVEQVLGPLARGARARYHFFDWAKDRYTEWHEVAREPTLVVEGVGAGSRVVRPYLSHLIWVEAPSGMRLARGLERDGQERRPEWERWREREAALFQREATREHADVRVDGAPAVRHDMQTEYVTLDHATTNGPRPDRHMLPTF